MNLKPPLWSSVFFTKAFILPLLQHSLPLMLAQYVACPPPGVAVGWLLADVASRALGSPVVLPLQVCVCVGVGVGV